MVISCEGGTKGHPSGVSQAGTCAGPGRCLSKMQQGGGWDVPMGLDGNTQGKDTQLSRTGGGPYGSK